jgi:hypothetical protein
MSLTGKPPQDLAVSNLAVKDTVVTASLSVLNVNAATLNGLSTFSTVQQIRSIFSGQSVGQWVVRNGIQSFSILGEPNTSPVTLPANTVLAQIDNYISQSSVQFPVFVYNPNAGSIATATVLATMSVSGDGSITIDEALESRGPVKGAVSVFNIKIKSMS